MMSLGKCLLLALTVGLVEDVLGSAIPAPVQDTRSTFALEDLIPMKAKFYADASNGEWISESEYVVESFNMVDKYNADTNTRTNLLSPEDAILINFGVSDDRMDPILRTGSISGYSKDARFLLISSDVIKVYRRSFIAVYTVYDLQKKTTHPVGSGRLQLCQWGRDGRSLAYVKNNNVHYIPDVTNSKIEVVLTTDGVPGEVYNGVQDWVYEEEVFESPQALWFSPGNKYLAMASYNDTKVDLASYTYYGSSDDINFLYPETVQFRYPKSGRSNPQAKLWVFDLSVPEKAPKSIPAPVNTVGSDHVLGNVAWATNDTLFVTWLNRRQNLSVTEKCDISIKRCKTVRKIREPRGWVPINTPIFDNTGYQLVDIRNFMFDGLSYPHVSSFNVNSSTSKDLTPGNSSAVSVLAWDTESNTVFCSMNPGEAPWKNEIWAVRDSGIECITCPKATGCMYASADFAPGGKYAVIKCSSSEMPTKTFFYNSKKHTMALWLGNEELAQTISKYQMPISNKMMLTLPEGVQVLVDMWLPANLDRTKKHPMIVKVYGGPGSTSVKDNWKLTYETYLASNRSFIVSYIDVRGSGSMSANNTFSVFNNLGAYETSDTLSAIRLLVEKYSFIDGSRVGVWGWSYGGYLSGMMLAQDDKKTVACAASVAPVTSWLFYDTIYTERYMDVPQNNPLGYKASELLQYADKFRDKKFLLIHGSADDNVHYQHSMLLAKLLQQHDIAFEQMSYVDQNHSLSAVHRHLYHTLDRFFSECFGE